MKAKNDHFCDDHSRFLSKKAFKIDARLVLACETKRVTGYPFVAWRCRFGGDKRKLEIRLRSQARLLPAGCIFLGTHLQC